MTLNNKKIIAVVMEYDFFKDMSEERRQKMLATDDVEWRVYIPRKRQDSLTEPEKKRLEGFVITDVAPVKVHTYKKEELFVPEMPMLIDRKKQEKFDKRAERKHLKRSVPLKIGKVNTKKMGRY